MFQTCILLFQPQVGNSAHTFAFSVVPRRGQRTRCCRPDAGPSGSASVTRVPCRPPEVSLGLHEQNRFGLERDPGDEAPRPGSPPQRPVAKEPRVAPAAAFGGRFASRPLGRHRDTRRASWTSFSPLMVAGAGNAGCYQRALTRDRRQPTPPPARAARAAGGRRRRRSAAVSMAATSFQRRRASGGAPVPPPRW